MSQLSQRPSVQRPSIQCRTVSRRGRAVLGGVVTASALIAALVAVPAQADPDDVTDAEVDEAAVAVDEAMHEIEAQNEVVNGITEEMDGLKSRIRSARADVRRLHRQYRAEREEFGAQIAQQQMDRPLGATASLLASEDATEFIDSLASLQAYNATQAEAVEVIVQRADQVANRRAQLADATSQLRRKQKAAETKRAEMRERFEEVEARFEELEAEQQEQIDNPGGVQTSTDPQAVEAAAEREQAAAPAAAAPSEVPPPSSGKAAAIIGWAQAQLGKPYVWGGTGPDGFDCSGLTQGAYAAAGISLPRVVGDQYAAMTPIPLSQAQPGDLVFYSSMSHVGIYIGGGRAIHAPRPGKSVEVAGMWGYDMAARIG